MYQIPSNIAKLAANLSKQAEKLNGQDLVIQYKEAVKSKDLEFAKELRNLLFCKYIKLLVKVAHKVITKHSLPGSIHEDIYQEAFSQFNIILDKYNEKKGTKFSTYLHNAIYHNLNRYISKNLHLIRDKRYLNIKYKDKLTDDDKIEYLRITEENRNYIFYKKYEEENKLIDRELIAEFLEEIKGVSPKIHRILEKVAFGEKLTKSEKNEFRRIRKKLQKFLQSKYGIDGVDSIYL